MPITAIKKQKGSKHKQLRASHFKDTHKYEKQRIRTAWNKARRIKKAEKLKAAASEKNED